MAFLLSQIEETTVSHDPVDIQQIQQSGDPNCVDAKQRPYLLPNPLTPHPVNIQEVDIFPGPHSWTSKLRRRTAAKSSTSFMKERRCEDDAQNIIQGIKTKRNAIELSSY